MIGRISSYLWQLMSFWTGKLRRKIASRFFGHDHYQQELQKEYAVLIDAASRLGIAVSDYGDGMLEFQRDGRSFFLRGNVSELESAISHKIAGDKHLTSILLQRHHLPVPPGACFEKTDLPKMLEYCSALNYPVVVKPRRGTSSGTGVSAGISARRALRKAFYLASFYDSNIVVEQYVDGEHIRLLMLGSELLSAVRRRPAAVTGNGRDSIRRLIRKTNRDREQTHHFPRLWPIHINGDLRDTLKRQQLSLRSIPADSEEITVKSICNGHQGGSVDEVTAITHPDFIAMATRALQICKVTLGGVDLITPDISQPDKGNSYINEINTTPSFYGHYQASNRKTLRDPARLFLQRIFAIEDSAEESETYAN